MGKGVGGWGGRKTGEVGGRIQEIRMNFPGPDVLIEYKKSKFINN